MSDTNRTDAQLIEELETLRARVALLEQAETAHQRNDQELLDALVYLESIFDTAHESLLVLDSSLHVKTGNRSFYQTFRTSREETEGRFLWELGAGEWNIPELRVQLEDVLEQNTEVRDLEVKHD